MGENKLNPFSFTYRLLKGDFSLMLKEKLRALFRNVAAAPGHARWLRVGAAITRSTKIPATQSGDFNGAFLRRRLDEHDFNEC
jgi:hypothetical protein